MKREFFKNWNGRGKRYIQNIKINLIAKVAKYWVKQLNLPNSEEFSSHSFHFKATRLADSNIL